MKKERGEKNYGEEMTDGARHAASTVKHAKKKKRKKKQRTEGRRGDLPQRCGTVVTACGGGVLNHGVRRIVRRRCTEHEVWALSGGGGVRQWRPSGARWRRRALCSQR